MSNFVDHNQWGRKVSLTLNDGKNLLDLSEFRIHFDVKNADYESPNNAAIRVYNLSQDTVKAITSKGEFTKVILQAGYETGNFGVIFSGTVLQFRSGRESNISTYLDIFAADGDIGYNQGVIAKSINRGAPWTEQLQSIVGTMPGLSLDYGSLKTDLQHVPSIRGTVLFGMARAAMRNAANHLDASWSIQDSTVVIYDNTGYRDGQAVSINSTTGMIGVPEQTDSGIRVRCLLNSKIRIGGRVHLNESDIVTTKGADPNSALLSASSWARVQNLAALSADGFYRAFVVEHEGDTRSDAWYTNLICLAVDETNKDSASSVQAGRK